MEKFCIQCGNQISKNSKFCTNCGRKLEETNNQKQELTIDKHLQENPQKTNNSGGTFRVFKYIFWIAVILGGVYLFVNYAYSNRSDNYSVTSTDNSTNSPSNSSNSFEDIVIKSDISEYIDTCKVLEYYGLDDNIKTDIKRILSDPNPDPENKVGTNCGQEERSCKWCSNVFNVEGTYSSIYQNVKNYVKPEDVFTAYAVAIAGAFSPSKVNAELVRCCNLYRNGERYLCDYNTQEFCSEKCKTEYKYNH